MTYSSTSDVHDMNGNNTRLSSSLRCRNETQHNHRPTLLSNSNDNNYQSSSKRSLETYPPPNYNMSSRNKSTGSREPTTMDNNNNNSNKMSRMSLKGVGARPLGFDIVAKVRRVQRREQSQRRLLMQQQQQQSQQQGEIDNNIPGPPPQMPSSSSYKTPEVTQSKTTSSTSLISELSPLTISIPVREEEDDDNEMEKSKSVFDVDFSVVEKEQKNQNQQEHNQKQTTYEILYEMILCKYVSILLIFVPISFILHFMKYNNNNNNDTIIFWINFLAMIPLASILGDFTEEVAGHTNQTIGGLVNATFGNAVEVVVGIQALLANEIRVVQASLIGSIFSNLLLVLGSCFLFGGIKYKEQTFNNTAATANMSLLALSSIALVLPTPFAEYYNVQDEHVLVISRFAAIFLMLMYIQLLLFQLHTHSDIFDDYNIEVDKVIEGNIDCCDGIDHDNNNNNHNDDSLLQGVDGINESSTSNDDDDNNDENDDNDEPLVSLPVALIGLFIVTIIIALLSDYLVDSIDGFVTTSGISRTFVGLIILPIVGNVVEHLTAITVAMKDKMDLAMGIAVGSCTQISLFVVPLMVIVGWIFNKNMTLNFPHFEIILYCLSIFTVSICLSNPKGNWLEGSLLITTYVMIAVGFWYENVIDF